MPVTWRCSGVAHAAFVSQISFYVYLCHLYDHVRVSQEYEGYGRFIGKQAMVYFWPCRVHFSFSKGEKKKKLVFSKHYEHRSSKLDGILVFVLLLSVVLEPCLGLRYFWVYDIMLRRCVR